MQINFSNLKVKQGKAPSAINLNVAYSENDPSLDKPIKNDTSIIEFAKLDEAEQKIVNDFVALMKSKANPEA